MSANARRRATPQTPPRPGLDDVRYKNARARLKVIGDHVCHWCAEPIDLQLHWPHPASWSCDHRVPRADLQPHDPRNWHIDNMLEAHLRCNQSRGKRPIRQSPTSQPPPPLDTSIDW